jgi:glutaminase
MAPTAPSPAASTGSLPPAADVRSRLEEAWREFQAVTSGANATYIPALASANPRKFGICLAETSGTIHEVGDTAVAFSLQSISKPFVFGLICQAIGENTAREKLGANSTGLPFNSVLAIERSENGTTNPMVNAGAIAAASLAPGGNAGEKWTFLREGLSRFAGRELALDHAVYDSEMATNQRNQGIASLLRSYQKIYCDPAEATEIYTRQCSLLVTARDLAVMAATLANGGTNPVTREPVIDALHCRHVLAVMVTAGLYETSGDWLYDTGLPGKSGVSGGLITVSPGKGGLGLFSPPLDEAGNSVRGQLCARRLSEQLGLNLFASRPYAAGAAPARPSPGPSPGPSPARVPARLRATS